MTDDEQKAKDESDKRTAEEAARKATETAGEAASGDSGGKDEGPKDEKGVPYRNRLAEADRKREKAEREARDSNVRAQQAEQLAREAMTRGDKPKEQPAATDDLGALMLTDPNAYQAHLLGQADKIVDWKLGQAKVMEQVFAEFPQIKGALSGSGSDEDKAFYAEVAEEYQQLRGYYGFRQDQHDNVMLKKAAESVERRHLKKEREARKKEEARLAAPNDERPNDSKPKKTVITDSQKAVAKAFGLSDADVADAYSRDLSEEIGAGR